MSLSPPAQRKRWTEAELQSLPENGFIHEVVNGELIISPKNNPEHGFICTEVSFALNTHVKRHKLGAVFDSNPGFWMDNENCRAPDVSFVSRERLRGINRPAQSFFRFAPDLAIEVLSANNSRSEIDERLRDFFSSGTKLVWIIDPQTKSAEICHSLEKRKLIGPNGVLDGETVLPGFTLRLAELFRDWNWD